MRKTTTAAVLSTALAVAGAAPQQAPDYVPPEARIAVFDQAMEKMEQALAGAHH